MSLSPPELQKRGARGTNLFARLGRPRLKHVIVAAVLASAVLAELAILGPAAYFWHREELRRLETETVMLLKANVDPTTFPSVADTLRIGQRLAGFSTVRGGTIVNVLGEELGSFGMQPALTFTAARRDGALRMLTPSREFLDVFLPPDATGLAHPLILRLDATRVRGAVIARLTDKAGMVLLIAVIAGLAIAVILSLMIVRPMMRLRDAATAATDNPGRADNFRLGWTRSDEIGDAGRAFDLLLTTVSIVHQEDLAASQEAVQRSAFAVLTYDPGGRLMSANQSALQLFGVENLDEIARLTPDYVRLKTVGESVDVSPIAMLVRGDVSQMVSVVTPKGVKRCFMSATTVKRKNSTILRHMVSFLDLSRQQAQSDKADAEIARLEGESASLRQRLAEMRALFESCLAILSVVDLPSTEGTVEVDEAAPIVLADRIVNTWFSEASRSGLVEARLEHAALPAVRGDPEAIEAVFRQALLTVYTRSESQKPALTVTGSLVGDGLAAFEVSESYGEVRPPRRSGGQTTQAGAAIASMALSQALHKAGGQLADFGAPGRRAVSFWLPAAAAAEDAPQAEAPPPKAEGRPAAQAAGRAYAGALRG